MTSLNNTPPLCLQVVAVFGSIHMGASRIMNLQRHRIAQCRSVVIRIFGDEGVPVQADGEAWLHPPGIIRIMHKNRVQITCRDRVSERLSAVPQFAFGIEAEDSITDTSRTPVQW